jgi:uncharacterized membrane protein YfcA
MTTADPVLVYLFALLLLGAVVGIMSGLFGVGGGFLMVPVQFWALGLLGVDPETALRTAFGTSLAVVIPTAASGAYAHHCRRCIRWDAVRWMGVSAAVAALAGALVSTRVPGRPLEVLLALVLMIAAVQLLLQRPSCASGLEERSLSPARYLALGAPGGLLSGLLGIGSGAFKVLAMDTGMRLPMKVSTTTSNFMIGVTAAGSAGVYFARGDVNPLIAAPVALGVLIGATLGSRLLTRLPNRTLRMLFVPLLLVVAVEMILRGLGVQL